MRRKLGKLAEPVTRKVRRGAQSLPCRPLLHSFHHIQLKTAIFLLAAGLPFFISTAAHGATPRALVQPNPSPVLTTAKQIRNLKPAVANLGLPVRLRGVVTYYGGTGWEIFVQDETAGIYVATEKPEPIKTGDLVEVTGRTSAGDFAPEVIDPLFHVLGKGVMPHADTIRLHEALEGNFDSQWLGLHGVVHSARASGAGVALQIFTYGGEFTADIPGITAAEAGRLVDANAVFYGACGTRFNDRRQIEGVELYIPGLSYVHILRPAPDPFTLPVRNVDSVFQFTPESGEGHRIRVQGTVTFQHYPSEMFIADATGSIYIATSAAVHVKPGERVDVVGFPSRGANSPMLEDAIFKPVGQGAQILPARLNARDCLYRNHDSELVEVEGTFQRSSSAGGYRYWILASGGVDFDVWLDRESKGQAWPSVR
ncbi:MAG: hypothetical protein KGM47_06745, partial [Acidobacteriota bacterium]|nr:hypothetical protein [Acidobacteriota bacterium]